MKTPVSVTLNRVDSAVDRVHSHFTDGKISSGRQNVKVSLAFSVDHS